MEELLTTMASVVDSFQVLELGEISPMSHAYKLPVSTNRWVGFTNLICGPNSTESFGPGFRRQQVLPVGD